MTSTPSVTWISEVGVLIMDNKHIKISNRNIRKPTLPRIPAEHILSQLYQRFFRLRRGWQRRKRWRTNYLEIGFTYWSTPGRQPRLQFSLRFLSRGVGWEKQRDQFQMEWADYVCHGVCHHSLSSWSRLSSSYSLLACFRCYQPVGLLRVSLTDSWVWGYWPGSHSAASSGRSTSTHCSQS